jgi:hypothetical protein
MNEIHHFVPAPQDRFIAVVGTHVDLRDRAVGDVFETRDVRHLVDTDPVHPVV